MTKIPNDTSKGLRHKPLESREVGRVITEYYSRPDKDIPPQDGDETRTHFFRSMIESSDDDRQDQLREEKLLDN